MRIITENGEFDLPKNFRIPVKKYNVMVSSAGEQSNPITLPPSPNNLKLIGYSNRIDRLNKPVSDIDVVVCDGLSSRQANLSVHTADEEDGISCTIYLGTADFYSRIDNTRLNWLDWPEIKSPTYGSQTLSERVDYLINLLKAEYNNPTPGAIYKIAPVATTQEYTFRFGGVDTTGIFVLNDFDKNNVTLQLASTDDYLDVWQGEYAQTLIESGSALSISKGYGITPFLKLSYVLEFIFGQYGYTPDMSELEEITDQYAHWCVGNNVADAIYAGILNTKQLVPDVTIKEFIGRIEAELSGKFVVYETLHKVKFRMYKNVLTADPTKDLTGYLQSKFKMDSAKFAELKIKDSNDKRDSISDSEKATVDITVELMPYGLKSGVYKSDLTPPALPLDISYLNVGEISHLNSSIVTPDVTKKSEIEISTKKVQLLYIPDEWSVLTGSRAGGYSFWNLYFKKTDRLFYGEMYDISETTLGVIEWLYDEYGEFMQYSNIKANAKIAMHEHELNMLDITNPVLADTQKVLIESIDYVLGGEIEDQEISVRTMRKYF